MFDDQPDQRRKVLDGWDMFVELAPNDVRNLLAGLPSFRNDRDVVALQAADLHAGWVRHLNEAEILEQPLPIAPWSNRGAGITRINWIMTAELAHRWYEAITGRKPIPYPRLSRNNL